MRAVPAVASGGDGQTVATLAKQETGKDGKVLTEIAGGWGSSTWSSWVKGRTRTGGIPHQSWVWRRMHAVEVEDDATGHEKANQKHG